MQKRRGSNFSIFNRRGISDVVATVLIILIVIAAITLVWAIVIPLISDSLGGVDCSAVNLQILTTEGYTVWDGDLNLTSVHVKRGPDNIELDGIFFKFTDPTGNSVVDTSRSAPASGNTKVYRFNATGNLTGKPIEISVAPIMDGFEICDVSSTITNIPEGDLSEDVANVNSDSDPDNDYSPISDSSDGPSGPGPTPGDDCGGGCDSSIGETCVSGVCMIPISSCGTLNQQGKKYYLANDLTFSNTGNCLSVSGRDISLDCMDRKVVLTLDDPNSKAVTLGSFSHNFFAKNCMIDMARRGQGFVSTSGADNITIVNSRSNNGSDFIVLYNTNVGLVQDNYAIGASRIPIVVFNSENVVVRDNVIEYIDGSGMDILGGSFNTISNNVIRDLRNMAISLSGSNTKIYNNTIERSREGIVTYGSFVGNNISSNIIRDTRAEAIFLYNSDNMIFEKNTLLNSGTNVSSSTRQGIWGLGAQNNTFIENNITDSGSDGIYLYEGSSGNSFTGNIITGSDGYGIIINNSLNDANSFTLNSVCGNTQDSFACLDSTGFVGSSNSGAGYQDLGSCGSLPSGFLVSC